MKTHASPHTAAFLILAVAFVFSTDADAAKRKPKAQKPPGPVATAVLPFSLDKESRGRDLKEAVELELELMDGVVLRSAAKPWATLKKRPADVRYSRETVKSALRGSRVSALVRGELGYTESGEQVLHVVVYGADGQARAQVRTAAPGEDLEISARQVVSALRPVLVRWRKKPPAPIDVTLPPPPASVAAEDGKLFAAYDDDKTADPAREAVDTTATGTATAASAPETAAAAAPAAAEAEVALPPRLLHMVAVSVGAGPRGWMYRFNGNVPDQSYDFTTTPYPEARLRLDLWPIEWVGLDVDLAGAYAPFKIGGANAVVEPDAFAVFQLNGGAALRGRYVLQLGAVGIGGGMRVGYRYSGALTDVQTNKDDKLPHTLVPGYSMHALAIGPEIFLPMNLLGRRIQLEARAEGLPLVWYAEAPDNPAPSVRAFGFHAMALARAEILFGAFAEAYVQADGVYATYYDSTGEDRAGDRLSSRRNPVNGQRVFVSGGTVLSAQMSGGLNLGFMF